MAIDSLPEGFIVDSSDNSTLPEGFIVNQQESIQEEPQEPQELSTVKKVARPFLQTAKNIAVGSLGSLGDIAQEAYYAPEAIARTGARALGLDVDPFDWAKINTVSPMIRGGFDELTGGLTAPRSKKEEVTQTVGEIAGGFIGPGAIKTAAQKTIDIAALIGKRTVQKVSGLKGSAQDLAIAFEEAGVNPTLANIAEGQTTKTFQNLLGNIPGSRGVIEKAIQSQVDDITTQIANIAKGEGGTVPQAGKVVQEGAQALKGRVRRRIGKLYDDLDKFIPKNEADLRPQRIKQLGLNNPEAIELANKPITDEIAIIPTNNLKTLTQDPQIQDVVAVGSGDTARVIKRYSEIVDEGNNISYPRLKTFRSTIGAKLQSPTLLGDEKAALKKIYGALSQDMKEAITAQGGEKGLQAFNKANSAFARSTALLDKKIDPLINAKTPSKVYDLLLSGTKQGGTDTKLIMKSLAPIQKDFVRGTVAREMGLATEGLQGADRATFSPNKFLTEYNKMRKVGTQRNLFTTEQNEAFTKLNKAIENIKDTSKARQTSNNLPYATWAGLGGLTVASPLAGVAAVTGANITAKMMTSPKFIKWLAQTPNIRNANITKHLKQLSIISGSAKSPELSEDILNYLESITIEGGNNGNQ